MPLYDLCSPCGLGCDSHVDGKLMVSRDVVKFAACVIPATKESSVLKRSILGASRVADGTAPADELAALPREDRCELDSAAEMKIKWKLAFVSRRALEACANDVVDEVLSTLSLDWIVNEEQEWEEGLICQVGSVPENVLFRTLSMSNRVSVRLHEELLPTHKVLRAGHARANFGFQSSNIFASRPTVARSLAFNAVPSFNAFTMAADSCRQMKTARLQQLEERRKGAAGDVEEEEDEEDEDDVVIIDGQSGLNAAGLANASSTAPGKGKGKSGKPGCGGRAQGLGLKPRRNSSGEKSATTTPNRTGRLAEAVSPSEPVKNRSRSPPLATKTENATKAECARGAIASKLECATTRGKVSNIEEEREFQKQFANVKLSSDGTIDESHVHAALKGWKGSRTVGPVPRPTSSP
jgi:hypothetical protein